MKAAKLIALASLAIVPAVYAGGAEDFDSAPIGSNMPGFNPSYFARQVNQWEFLQDGLRIFPADLNADIFITMSTLADSPYKFIYGSRWTASANPSNPNNDPNLYGLSPDRSVAIDFYTTDGSQRLAASSVQFAIVDEGTPDQVGDTWTLLVYGLNDALLDTVTGNTQGIYHLDYSRPQADIGRVVFVPSFDHEGIDTLGWQNIPSPGALALLGLGGLVAGRRRR